MLETTRLLLREMSWDDLDVLAAIFADAEVMRFYPRVADRGLTALWLQRNLQRYSQYGFGVWAMVLKATGQVIGGCGLVPQLVEGQPEVEISYHLCRRFWGQGLATEAARVCRDYGFQQFHCPRLIALIHPDNHSSRRVAEKTGMQPIKQLPWLGQPTWLYAVAPN